MSDLFGGLYSRGEVAAEVSGEAWLRAMLDVEASLARACAREGLIAEAEAEAVVEACRARDLDLDALAAETGRHATPAVGLVRALRERGGAAVHLGATSQDVVDTAAM